MKITLVIPDTKLIGLEAIEKALKLSRMHLNKDQLSAALDIVGSINKQIDNESMVKYIETKP